MTLLAFAVGCAAPPVAAQPPRPIPMVRISVDATGAPQHVVRSHLVMQVRPGPLSLVYPKWIPGEHGPTGPLVNLAGPMITAAGRVVPWRRDSEFLYEFHVDVPEGTTTLDVDLVFLEPFEHQGFSAGASTTAELVDLAWNHLLLYPKGASPDQTPYAATLKLPAGWKWSTALPVARADGSAVEFAPVSLTTLIDSPVVAGAHSRTIALGPEVGPKHEIDLVADSEEALEMTAQQIAAYRQLVAEAFALFGTHHYRSYHFLYTLSDHVASFGLEHHESSDNRVGERTLVDDQLRRAEAGLLPHEFVHSWNGKYRRPVGLVTRDYQEPMRGDLLWVYEGLTQYLGWVLTGRSGLLSAEEEHEWLAETAAHMDAIPGRRWRSLEDTAVAAQVLYGAGQPHSSMRRGVDYYPEGLLIWLEADVQIRELTGGHASLDDFCRRFHGGRDDGPEVRPYDLDEIVRTLQAVAPFDWKGFFESRVSRPTDHAPLGGITHGGYKLVFTERPNLVTTVREKVGKVREALYSLGIVLGEHDEVLDALAGKPAAAAGLSAGMRVVALDGRRFTAEVLHEALARTKRSTSPLAVLVENGDYFRTVTVDWHGGELHPHLERSGGADFVDQILSPKTPRPAEAVASPPQAPREEGR